MRFSNAGEHITTADVRIARWDLVCRIPRRTMKPSRRQNPAIAWRRVRLSSRNRSSVACITNTRLPRHQRARNGSVRSYRVMSIRIFAEDKGVVGSSPAGRARFQGLGRENQVLLLPVGPLWDLLSTGPHAVVTIQALGVKNQVLLSLLWNRVGLLIRTFALAARDA